MATPLHTMGPDHLTDMSTPREGSVESFPIVGSKTNQTDFFGMNIIPQPDYMRSYETSEAGYASPQEVMSQEDQRDS